MKLTTKQCEDLLNVGDAERAKNGGLGVIPLSLDGKVLAAIAPNTILYVRTGDEDGLCGIDANLTPVEIELTP